MKKGILTSGLKYSYRNYLRIGPLVIKDGDYTYNFYKGRSKGWYKLWLEDLKHRYKPDQRFMQNASFMIPKGNSGEMTEVQHSEFIGPNGYIPKGVYCNGVNIESLSAQELQAFSHKLTHK